MDSCPSAVNANGRGSKCEKTRRSWSVREEEALIEALKAGIDKGLKSENGFRCGYLSVLETKLNKMCQVRTYALTHTLILKFTFGRKHMAP